MGLWEIKQTIHFQEWFDEADDQLQEDIVENVVILQHFGPHLGKPKVDYDDYLEEKSSFVSSHKGQKNEKK